MKTSSNFFGAGDLIAGRAWSSDLSPLECVAVFDQTADVKTFVMRSVEPAYFDYLPGQYLTLQLIIDEETVHRSYTLASSPTRPGLISITNKRVPGGRVSNWMHDNLRPGMQINALDPQGVFSCLLLQKRERILMLSGGSGITPMLSMTRSLVDNALPLPVDFIHAARSPRDLICQHELELMAQSYPQLNLHWVVEDQQGQMPVNASVGRVSVDLLNRVAPHWQQSEIYCCGPAAFMDAVRDMVQATGFDMAHYHRESFDFATMLSESADSNEKEISEQEQIQTETAQPDASTGPNSFSVTFSKRGQTIAVEADSTIMTAAAKAGIFLPASCQSGICGTCRTLLQSGRVAMNHQGGLLAKDEANGYILTCCSKPLADLTLDL